MEELDTNVMETQEQTVNANEEPKEPSAGESAEIARLKAELAKAKAATDKATKEAGDFRKQLRAKQTAEEQAAEAEQERQAAIEQELQELRKERAVANSSKRVMAFIPEEQTATSIAEALYGAADIDLAVDLIEKAWTAREKSLRLEFGKIPAPGIGDTDGPTITKTQLDGMAYKDRVEFASKHRAEYDKLMGR